MINFSKYGKPALLMISLLVSGAFNTAAAFDTKAFSLEFGDGKEKLGYYNSSVKNFEEPYPAGPSAFCIIKGKTVSVLDTFNHSLKQFDEKGKLISSLNIAEMVKKDLKLTETGLASVSTRTTEKGDVEFAISDRVNGKIYIISGGKLFKTIGGADKSSLGQAEETSYDTDGSIAVCDWAANKVHIFDKTGKAVLELPSQLNGIYFSSGAIYYIEKSKDGKISFMKTDVASNKSEKVSEITQPALRIAKLLAVDAKGNFITAFFDDSIQEKLMKKDGEKAPMGFFTVTKISAAGKTIASENIPVTTALGSQFFFDRSEDKLYYQDYNAETAPKGAYTIKELKLDK